MASNLTSFPRTVKINSNEWTLWWSDSDKSFEANRSSEITTVTGKATLKLSVKFNSVTPDSGEGRVKVAMKQSLRRLAMKMADGNLQAVICDAHNNVGLLPAFNPAVRFAAACEIVGI